MALNLCWKHPSHGREWNRKFDGAVSNESPVQTSSSNRKHYYTNLKSINGSRFHITLISQEYDETIIEIDDDVWDVVYAMIALVCEVNGPQVLFY